METWSHGQAIFDVLGLERVNTDGIKGIAVLGINAYKWTFSNRGLAVPGEPPCVKLNAPSGALWEWITPETRALIEGRAEEFCQVVTQTRNIADTGLRVRGESAVQWMAIAQCFAGPPEDPPLPGTRFRLMRPQSGNRS